jgi:GTP-binding protein Era
MKAGIVAVVGRPSSGKSTLLNRICGHKVSIVSPTPQTTRNRIRGILTAPEGQLVFIDTPGYHQSEKKFNLHLQELVHATLKEAEAVLYLVDVTRPPGAEEEELMGLLQPMEDRVVVGLNKIDRQPNHRPRAEEAIRSRFRRPRIHPVSALTGEGVADLLRDLFALVPEGERLYPGDYYTDQTPEFRIAEIVREKVIHQTRQEVPHHLYVEVADLEMQLEIGQDAQPGTDMPPAAGREMQPDPEVPPEPGERDEEAPQRLWARVFIFVERESQKGIVVGKGGEKIRAIVRQAEEELAGLFPYPVELDVRVKVQPKWRRNESLLRRLIG